jgi:hypothetical protein
MLAHTRILQLDVLGSFDFYTHIVSLDAVESTQFDALAQDAAFSDSELPLSLEEFHSLDSVLPLLAHELTHFIDATSTIWGMRHLSLLDAAYSAMVRGEEPQFFKIKALHDHLRLLRLPQYYTTQGPAKNAARPWRYQISVGRRYTSTGHLNMATSVTFCRFACDGGELLVRSPLSTVSLLETSAMAQELLVRAALLGRLDKDAAIIESRLLSQRTLEYLYNRELTEYSVCAHLVANQLGIEDVLLAFSLSGTIARWVLNAPVQVFERVAGHAPLGRILGVGEDHEYIIALRDGIRARDMGALYHAIVSALPSTTPQKVDAVQEAIEASLESLTLHSETVAEWRAAEIAHLFSMLSDSECPALRQLAASGLSNHIYMKANDFVLPFNSLDLPKVLFRDCEYRHAWGNPTLPLAQVDPEIGFAYLHSLELFANRFAEACV